MYGFYQELEDLREDFPEADFGFMANTFLHKCSDKRIFDSINAYDFLHGHCATFAYLLSKLLNYPIFMRQYTVVDDAPFIHVWCEKDGWFIDARGYTRDFSSFWSEFEDWDSFDLEDDSIRLLHFKDYKEFSAYLQNKQWEDILSDKELLKAAQTLYEDYEEYYIVPN